MLCLFVRSYQFNFQKRFEYNQLSSRKQVYNQTFWSQSSLQPRRSQKKRFLYENESCTHNEQNDSIISNIFIGVTNNQVWSQVAPKQFLLNNPHNGEYTKIAKNCSDYSALTKGMNFLTLTMSHKNNFSNNPIGYTSRLSQ